MGGLAVVQVILSVFIQQTFKVAAQDERVMINEKEAQSNAIITNLQYLFDELDTSGDGHVDKVEFQVLKSDPVVKTWFSALEVDLGDIDDLFLLLDNGDGYISRNEFVDGIRAMRGLAKKTDILEIKRLLKKVDSSLKILPLENVSLCAPQSSKKQSVQTPPSLTQQMTLSCTTVEI